MPIDKTADLRRRLHHPRKEQEQEQEVEPWIKSGATKELCPLFHCLAPFCHLYVDNFNTRPHSSHMIEVRQTAVFSKWWDGLRDRRAQGIIANRIARIQGGLLGDIKRFDSLIEFRIDHGPGYRLYAVQRGDVLIILLCGGNKSSQNRDIGKARELAGQLE